MAGPFYLPVTDPKEIATLVEELPISVDREHFQQFVLGFPRSYLVNTPRVEIVKHYFLMEGLRERPVISQISREGQYWRLNLVARDRRHLFSRIAGTLSCMGMDIVSAEAFANANLLVLDSFLFSDPAKRFSADEERLLFQQLLEEVLEGKVALETLLKERWPQVEPLRDEEVAVRFDNEAHPVFTRLEIDYPDQFGLLYLISRSISSFGLNIEMAYVSTRHNRARDTFYLTRDSKKLTSVDQARLQEGLLHLQRRLKENADRAASSIDPPEGVSG